MPATITEVKDADQVTLGLGVLGLSTLPLASPAVFVDVGYIKSCTLTYTRELKDFESAGLLVKRLTFRDRLKLDTTYAQVSITNLQKLIPSTLSNTSQTMTFGGSRTITRYGVRFEHTRDDAKIVTVEIFKAVPAGGSNGFALAFAEEAFITYPVDFDAELDTAKTSGQQYGKITIAA